MRIRQPPLGRFEFRLGRRPRISCGARYRPTRIPALVQAANGIIAPCQLGTAMPKRILTPCEAEIMNVVWQRGAVTVPDVVDALPRPLAYTTVMTTMKILENKGFI